MDESSSLILTGYPFGHSGNRLMPLLDQSAGIDSCDVPFCTRDNVNDCIDYINQEFLSVGLPSICNGSSKAFDLPSLINAAYQLLTRFRQCLRSRDNLQDSKNRALSDLEHQQTQKTRLQSKIEQLERDLSQAQFKEKQLLKANKTVNNKLKLEKEENKKLQMIVQSRDAQYRHSVKKKETELVKLKDRLHTLLIDRSELKIGIELSDMLTRADGKRGRWKSVAANNVEEELYRGIISSYEERQKVLIVENHELRQGLNHLQKELHSLLCLNRTADNNSVLNVADTVLSENEDPNVTVYSQTDADRYVGVADGLFMMPYSIVQEDLLQDIKEKIANLRTQFHLLRESAVAGTDADASARDNLLEERYQAENCCLHTTLERYQSLTEPDQESAADVDDLAAEREQLASERRVFYEQLAAFEEKKRDLAELEFRLNKERIAFEMSKCNLTSTTSTTNMSAADIQRPRSAQSTPLSSQKANYKRALPNTPASLSTSRQSSMTSSDRQHGTVASRPTSSIVPRSSVGQMHHDILMKQTLLKASDPSVQLRTTSSCPTGIAGRARVGKS